MIMTLLRRRQMLGFLAAMAALWGALLPNTALAGYTGGTGSGWAQCGSFYISTDTQANFWWDSYYYDLSGTNVIPYQGLILVHDPNHYMSSACGPLSWTNQITFSNYATDAVPTSNACWAFQYDTTNYDGKWGCNRNGYWYPYDGTYGSANWGATVYPWSSFVGAFNAGTPQFSL